MSSVRVSWLRVSPEGFEGAQVNVVGWRLMEQAAKAMGEARASQLISGSYRGLATPPARVDLARAWRARQKACCAKRIGHQW